jgi:hypothetical protein
MEREDFVKDELLKKLVGKVPLESPSGNFTQKVMEGLSVLPETAGAKKPFYLFLKNWSPWVLLGLFILLFLFSSDIPYLTFIPGTEYVHDHILPYITAFAASMGRLFTQSKTLSLFMAIMVAGALLWAVDWFVRRRTVTHHQAA